MIPGRTVRLGDGVAEKGKGEASGRTVLSTGVENPFREGKSGLPRDGEALALPRFMERAFVPLGRGVEHLEREGKSQSTMTGASSRWSSRGAWPRRDRS